MPYCPPPASAPYPVFLQPQNQSARTRLSALLFPPFLESTLGNLTEPQNELDSSAVLQVRKHHDTLQSSTNSNSCAFESNHGSIVASKFMKTFQIHWLTMLAAAVLCVEVSALGENWPAWRGPAGTGVANEKHLPQRWGTNENVRWRTPLPERGNSTPIVWGNQVFVTQAAEAEKRRALLCFDRATGRLLWQQGATVEAAEPTHETNPQCSSSPVTDGERVIAWFGSA